MSTEILVKKFYKINLDLYNKAKNPLKCHGPDHHARVCENALWLAKEIKADFEPEVLIPACFLHDVTGFYPEKSEDEHNRHHDDTVHAEKALKKISYPADKITKILHIITLHGSDPKLHSKNEPIEATLLRDADKMDIFGPLGVSRIIMALTRRGKSLNEIVDVYHAHKKIEQKFKAITFPAARAKVRKNYEYSKLFFKELDHTLTKNS